MKPSAPLQSFEAITSLWSEASQHLLSCVSILSLIVSIVRKRFYASKILSLPDAALVLLTLFAVDRARPYSWRFVLHHRWHCYFKCHVFVAATANLAFLATRRIRVPIHCCCHCDMQISTFVEMESGIDRESAVLLEKQVSKTLILFFNFGTPSYFMFLSAE